MILATSDRLTIRAYEGTDADDSLLAGWLSDRRVLEWFEGRDRPHDRALVRERYGPEALAAAQVRAAIFADNGWPLGYLRWYPMSSVAEEYDWSDDTTDVWAADIFVGDPNRWGRGLGSAALALLVEHLMVVEGARRVVVDPWVGNARAIRAYDKIGFRTIGIHHGHELFEGERRDCWLMAIDALDHPVGLATQIGRLGASDGGPAGGAAPDQAVVDLVERWARSRGLDVHVGEVAPGRRNVVCVRRGSGGGRTLLLNGRPDNPAGLAAALLTAESVADGQLAGDLIVAAVADDGSGVGTEVLVRDWKADGAVVLEPTAGQLVCRHRGVVVLDVALVGRPAPAALPELGLSGVSAAARVIAAVEALDARWAGEAGDPVFRPSVVVSGVESPSEPFMVPGRCELNLHVHTTSLVTASQVDPVATTIREAAAPVDVEVTTVLTRRPVQLRESHRLVEQAVAAVSSVTGGPVTAGSAPSWTVAALHALAGTPAIVYGPSPDAGDGGRTWASSDAIRHGAEVLAALATTFCAPR